MLKMATKMDCEGQKKNLSSESRGSAMPHKKRVRKQTHNQKQYVRAGMSLAQEKRWEVLRIN